MKRKKRGNGEGTVFEDKKRNRWVAQYVAGINEQGKPNRKSIYAKTQKEVLKKLNEAQYKINNNIYIEKNGIELVKIMEDIREEKFASNIISEGQYFRLEWTIKKIKNSSLGKAKIQNITSEEIQDFLNSISDLSDSYIKKIYEQFVQAYERAEIKKYISYNPMKEVTKPKSKTQTKEVEALTIEQQKTFVKYLLNSTITEEPYKNIFLIQLYMGLRIGEVLALCDKDIDLKNKLLYVNRSLTLNKQGEIIVGRKTKTYSGKRELPIPEFLIPIFEEQLKYVNLDKNNLLFTQNNEYIKTSYINDALKRIFSHFSDEDRVNISSHCLRHTYGTRCIEGGMTAVVLQRLMGHKDIKVTLNTYTSVFNKFKGDEIDKVNTYLVSNNLCIKQQ